MLASYSWIEISVFCVIITAALVIDLVAHRQDRPISMKNAALWSMVWISLALIFAIYIWQGHDSKSAKDYLTCYLLEKSLSVDNLFVFMAIFSSFAVKDAYQHRILYYGILGALVMRFIFIAVGASLLHIFEKYALTIFGLFVLWSAWKMWQESRKPDKEIVDYTHHWAVALARRFFRVSNKLDGHNFFTKIDGLKAVTPLFLCLLTVETADVMFAFDSVPAALGISSDPFIVYTSNVFAILGLRSLYFLLAAARHLLCHLENAVIVILAFIGVKMLLDVAGIWHIGSTYSLIAVTGLLVAGVAASYIFPNKNNCEKNLPPK